MGLRWLNGHAVDYKIKSGPTPKNKKAAQEALEDKRKRLIVEFAIENANVVNRRSDREEKSREAPKSKADGEADNDDAEPGATKGQKRKRDSSSAGQKAGKGKNNGTGKQGTGAAEAGAEAAAAVKSKDGKLAQRTRIIAKKRQARKARKAGK
jgi:nucleolar protein 4